MSESRSAPAGHPASGGLLSTAWRTMSSALGRRFAPSTQVEREPSDLPSVPADIVRSAERAAGFLDPAEGQKLFELAFVASVHGPCLEIGSYCGKSTIYLAAGCRAASGHPLFAVDHHRGSVEQQKGQEYFDEALYDTELDSIYTLDRFTRNLHRAGLADWVIPVIAPSERLARYWTGAPLGLLFIDGGHAIEDVSRDFEDWAPRVVRGGYSCLHDIYLDPAEGGQAPRQVFEQALDSGPWLRVGLWGSLGVLRRK